MSLLTQSDNRSVASASASSLTQRSGPSTANVSLHHKNLPQITDCYCVETLFFAAALLVHVYAVTIPEVASVTFVETDHPTPRTTPNTLAAFSIINPVAVLFFFHPPKFIGIKGLVLCKKANPSDVT